MTWLYQDDRVSLFDFPRGSPPVRLRQTWGEGKGLQSFLLWHTAFIGHSIYLLGIGEGHSGRTASIAFR